MSLANLLNFAPTQSGPFRMEALMITVDVWSDVACPWCYLGKRRLESAIDASTSSQPYFTGL